jgi:hypothetical protein
MNLSFNRKVILVVKVIYIYIATSISLINITLGLYVLSTNLNESNVTFSNILLVIFLYWNHF